jgi:hypothetical protein
MMSSQAKVWACPGQWSWPVNLPPFFRVDAYLKDNDTSAPWADEIQQVRGGARSLDIGHRSVQLARPLAEGFFGAG